MSEQPTSDPNMEFERPADEKFEDGQNYYGETDAAPGEYVEETAQTEAAAPKSGGSKTLINVGIFGGVIIFALIMAWVNFGSVLFPKSDNTGASIANPSAMLTPASPQQPITSPVPAPTDANGANPNATVQPAGAPVDMSAAAAAQPVAVPGQVVPGGVTSSTPAIPGAPTDISTLSVTPAVSPTPGTAAIPAPGAGTTPVVASVLPAATAIPGAPLSVTPTPAGTPTAVTPTQPAAITPVMPSQPALATPADNSKLVELQQQNQLLSSKNAEQESTISDLKTQLSDMQSKLTDTNTKIDQLQATKTVKAATPKVGAKKIVAKKKAVTHHAVAAAKPMPLTDSSDGSPVAALGEAALASPPPYWILRSAEGNSAWVAHPGDGQLYQVTVGDQLPGIGKITSIQQQAGIWTIVGTQGQIKQ